MESNSRKFWTVLCYFLFLSLLWNVYRISSTYLYDTQGFFKELVEVFFPLGIGFITFYIPTIAATLSRIFSVLKSIIVSVLLTIIWVGCLYVILGTESFGYLIFYLPLFVAYLAVGVVAGYLYKKAIVNSRATIILFIPIVVLILLISFNFFQGSSVSKNECGTTHDTRRNIDCYYASALQNNDYSLCFNIGQWANNTEEDCIISVFDKIAQTGTLDSSYCDLPLQTQPLYPSGPNKSVYIKSMCLYGVGAATRDVSVCEKISNNDYAKMNCERQALKK
jgi:hypothetical protein